MPEWEDDPQRIQFAIEEALKIPGVHSVYIGPPYKDGRECDYQALCVFVGRKRPLAEIAPADRVPKEIAGIPTDVIESDPPQRIAEDNPAEPTTNQLPVFDDEAYSQMRGGISIEGAGMQGTLGCIARATDSANNNRLVLLSNQHVLAGKTNGVGKTVRQPEESCCCCGKKIGVVLRTRNTMTGDSYKNHPNIPSVDAGIALLNPGIECLAEIQMGVGNGTATEPVRGVLPSAQIKAPLAVKKRGMRTGLKEGHIISTIGAHAPDNNEDKAMAFRNQIVIRLNNVPFNADGTFWFASKGDSGSVILTQTDNQVVALLWGTRTMRPNKNKPNHVIIDGMATNIHDVTSAMQISIETTNTAGQVITVPAAPSALPDAPPSALSPQPITRTMMDEARFQIERTTYGQQYATRIRQHHAEVLSLVRTNRRVGAIWNRYGGQAILQAILDAVGRPDEAIPSIVGERPLTESAARIASILRRYGSLALRRDLDEYERMICGLCGCSYNQLLARLRAGESLAR